MKVSKILLSIALPNTSLRVVHQVAFLARHFDAEIVLLHVMTPFSFPAGVLEAGHELTPRDLNSSIVKQTREQLDQSLQREFDGLVVKRLLLRGDAAREIVRTACEENVDLIAMSTRSFGVLYRFLLGSVTVKVLHEREGALWSDRFVEDTRGYEFAIRRVLCAIDLGRHSRNTLAWATQVAAEFHAVLTLVHVTPAVEIYGPGGAVVVPDFRDQIVGGAAKEIAQLQQEAGTNLRVIIASGDVPSAVKRAAEQSKADLLLIGRLPAGGHLGANGGGYGLIRGSQIPVLSVSTPIATR